MEMNNIEDKGTRLNGQSFAIPVAIIIGFAFIAAAIYLSGTKDTGTANVATKTTTEERGLDNLNPVTDKDHILGNPNAPIVVVEYSDFDCPFCKQFHETMHQIIDEYGISGNVAWVYRHMPIQTLHPSAPYLALASECVAKEGGNDAFWKFTDLIFGERAVNEQTNVTRLPEFAETAGVDKTAFQTCVDNQETKADIEEDFNNAISLGINGTPHSILIIGDQKIEIKGAQPYSVVKGMIDSALKGI